MTLTRPFQGLATTLGKLTAMTAITITGADDATDVLALIGMAALRPAGFLEWGVLYSLNRAGSPRYPSLSTIDKIARLSEEVREARFSLHICGRAVHDFIAGRGHAYEVARVFPRIQINFAAAEHDLEGLRERIAEQPERTVITQRNVANARLWPAFSDLPNHAYLFDSSGGRGLRRSHWPSALLGVACGWSGGLGPDNLATELPRIHAAAMGRPYWVDMEGHMRDERDHLDQRKARACIAIVEAFNNGVDEEPELQGDVVGGRSAA